MQEEQILLDSMKEKAELKKLAQSLQNSLGSKKLTPELATEYARMAVALENLANKYDTYFTRQDDGKMPILSLNQRDGLLKSCKEIADISEKINNIKPNTKMDKMLLKTSGTIQDFVSKDMKALIKMKEPKSLASIIQSGRKRVIDISDQKTGSTGGNVSERIIIKDGDKTAFFTENKRWNTKKEVEAFTNKYVKNYPQYKKFFSAVCKEEYLDSFDSEQIPVDGSPIYWQYNEQYKQDFTSFNDNTVNVIKANGLKDFFMANLQNEEFMNLFYNFCEEATSLNVQISMNDNILQLDKNEPVDERNAGMSIVAGLLGCNTLLAHSEPVTLIKNGKEINGTLMDKAEGVDLNNSELDDEARFYNESTLNNTQTKKQLADLQVIDFICGNVDRHMGNMFFSFEKDNLGYAKCNKIVGIDNDLSFTTLSDNYMLNGASYMSGLANLKVISEDMADKISTTTPAMMKLALRGLKIDEKAINQCIKRFTMLKDMVKERSVKFDKESGKDLVDTSLAKNISETKINIIPDEKWEKISLTEAAPIEDLQHPDNKTKNNAFKGARGFIKNMTSDLKDVDRAKRATMVTTGKLRHSFVTTKLELPIQMKVLKSGNSIFRGTSEQYENIKTQLTNIENTQKQLGNTPTNEQLKDFCRDINGAIATSQEYLDRKQREAEAGKKFGRYTRKRIQAMVDYNKYLTDKHKELTSLIKKDENAKDRASQIETLSNAGRITSVEQVREKLKINDKNVSKQVQVNKDEVNKGQVDITKAK